MGHINKLASVIIVAVFLFADCYGQQKDILATLESFTEFSQFKRILYTSNLNLMFSGTGKRMTLFAFNNSAYDALPSHRKQKINQIAGNQDLAHTFIQAHTVYGSDFTTSDMNGANVKENSMNGLPLFVNKRTQSDFTLQGTYGATLYYVNGAQLNNNHRDMQCNNGYLHSLNGVMHVPSEATAHMYIKTPQDSQVQSREFYSLLNNLQVPYYDPVYYLSYPLNTLTFFVPSDAAIRSIPASKRSQLIGDKGKLEQIAYAHFIPRTAIFTDAADHNKGFQDGNENTNQRNRITIRKPNLDTVYINSLGVNAKVIYGNVTVRNGVIHVIDKLLGFVYYTVREEISQGASQFEQLINRASPQLAKSLTDQSDVTVFVPTNEAFQNLANVPGINLNMLNQSIADTMLKLSMLYPGRTVEVSALTGAYESRMYVESQDDGVLLAVFNERNESWVQGGQRGQGGVKAKIISADISCTNGRVNYIDSVLGIPYLDLPMTICDDLWLLKTYDHIKSLGMVDYLKDRRFEAKRCYFEMYGYPPNWGSSNQYQFTTPYNPQWWLPGVSTTTPKNVVNRVAHNMGYCGQNRIGCEFTFFVPNSTAIDKFQSRREGQVIMADYPRFQFLIRRLIVPNRKIILSDMAEGTSQPIRAHNGDYITVRKSGTRNYELYYKESRATVIHADQASTNGVMHIISDILYDRSDLDRDVSAGSYVSFNLFLLGITLFLSAKFFIQR